MMQSTDLGNFDHPAKRGRLDCSASGCIFVEREVRSKTKKSLIAIVGTMKKPTETNCLVWFLRKVRQVCDGGLRCRTRYLATDV